MKLTKNFLFFIISSLLLATSPYFAQAQTATGLTAIPPRLEITANPGEVITKEIKVRNESKTQRSIDTTIKDFIVTDDDGTPLQIESSDNRWAASSWIQVSPAKTRLLPGETKSLILTIIVPDNVLAGGHYAVVLHSPQNEITLSETGATIETFVGTLVYITIPGEINQFAKVKDFSAPAFSEYGPINFKTIISNLSDIHIKPMGAISITDWFGKKVSDIPLPETNIFPYTNRELTAVFNQKWLLGRYKAELLAGYGTAGGALSATIFFWVFPIRIILLALSFIIIITILISLLRKKKRNPKSVEELEIELNELRKKYKDRK